MKRLNKTESAYIAGFLDGDGSIYVRIKPDKTYRFGYQICPYVVFYQARLGKKFLKYLQNLLKIGYLRDRKDGIREYIIGDKKSIKKLLYSLLPHLKLKKAQAKLMLDIFTYKENVKNSQDFLRLCRSIDKFKNLNYSKKRKQTSKEVKILLKSLTP